jgi:hypothetical protein
MGELRGWVELAPDGWDFRGPDREVSPTEFRAMNHHFQETGELPNHKASRAMILRLQDALDTIEVTDGGATLRPWGDLGQPWGSDSKRPWLTRGWDQPESFFYRGTVGSDG